MTKAIRKVTDGRSVIFGAESVRAILGERKTQTRRVIKNPDKYERIRECGFCCPYGKVGERLWVRETYCAVRDTEPSICSDVGVTADNYGLVAYKATTSPNGEGLPVADSRFTWKSPIFMPRRASRITLEITNIRVERLQEITREDAIAEGVHEILRGKNFALKDKSMSLEQHAYAEVWDSLNAKRKGCSWSENPWAWILEFKRVKP